MISLALAALALLLPTPPPRARAGPARMSAPDRDGSLERELRERVTARGGVAGASFGEAHVLLENQASAFVLLFNPGQRDEGVYTLESKATSRETCLVVFEEGEAAERFSHLLSAEGFDLAHPAEWSAEQICHFCTSLHFGLGFVSSEALLLPPRHNVYDRKAFEEAELWAPPEQPRDEDPDVKLARLRLEREWRQQGGS